MPSKYMASELGTLTIVDVYEMASAIGMQFEKMIDNHGPESVTDLMPKVIRILEHLEDLTGRRQKENTEICELQYTVERLQLEKNCKAQERLKYEKELEQIEEYWRSDAKELRDQISQLEESNQKLRVMLQNKELDHTMCSLENERERELQSQLQSLHETVHKQQEQLRQLQRDVAQKNTDSEALQSQLENLMKQNADYRRKATLAQKQAQMVIEDKSDLQALLYDKDHLISQLQSRISQLEKQNIPEAETLNNSSGSAANESGSKKLLVDGDDPNRPRFTMNELKSVLDERNEIKTRLSEVQEELSQYRSDTTTIEQGEVVTEDDAPVQGPINREPDEKLYPERYRTESGIRRFFRQLLSPSNKKSVGSTARRKTSLPLAQTTTSSPLLQNTQLRKLRSNSGVSGNWSE